MKYNLLAAIFITISFVNYFASARVPIFRQNFELSNQRTTTQGVQNKKCPEFQIYGFPEVVDSSVAQRGYYMCRLSYAGMYDPMERTPLWISEHLIASSTKGDASRKEIHFVNDPEIPVYLQATDYDYQRSGYQKGHMAPAADFKNSQNATNESFLYSNAIPQSPQNNMYVWNYLESSTREVASRRGDIYIITGPVFTIKPRQKINGRVSIPDAIFKILIDPHSNSMTGFIIPNNDSVGQNFNQFQVSVREVEKATGINFNPSLRKAQADQYEIKGGNWLMPAPRTRNRF